MSNTPVDGGRLATQVDGGPGIEAEMVFKAGRSVPDVFLSFDGLNPPTPMLADLAAIGWDVPPIPPRPSSAIEWVPDLVAGTDYTIHPWRVDDFVLGRSDWNQADGAMVASQTLATLQRYGVRVDAPPDQTEQLQDAPAAAPMAAPTGAPRVVLIRYEGAPNPRIRHAGAAAGGRKRVGLTWAESTDGVETLCPTGEARLAMAADSEFAWEVHYTGAPAVPVEGHVAICAAVPGTAPDDKKLNKLVGMLGGSIQVAALIPLDIGDDTASALVFGVVPAANAELAISNLRLRCKSAILRNG